MKKVTGKALENLMRTWFKSGPLTDKQFEVRYKALAKIERVLDSMKVLTLDEMCEIEYSL